ncbi:MAG: lamin tail domain-containing protein [Microgenomates group bacterium]
MAILLTKTVAAGVKINEIYPAPPTGGYEWIELYNDENYQINIEGLILSDLAGNKIKINETVIPPLGFVTANSSSILNNNGDTIFLKNNLDEIIEIATYSGNFDSSKTYAKCPNGNGSWFILNQPTKNASNEIACLSLTPTPIISPTEIFNLSPTPNPTATPTPVETPNPTPEPTLISYDNIYLSEVMVYPPSGENEWVEIYNGNDFPVSLVNWYLDDLENAGSSPKIFSLEIGAKSYGVFELSSSMFNNSGDSVRLLDFNKFQKDSFEYPNATQGKTYGRVSFDSDDFCLQEASRNLPNNICLNPTITATPKSTPSPTPSSTPSPTPFPTPRPTKKPPPITPFTQTPKIDNISKTAIVSQNITQGEVLSATSQNKKQNQPLINSLSFLSFSYSIATIFSIVLKIIKNI